MQGTSVFPLTFHLIPSIQLENKQSCKLSLQLSSSFWLSEQILKNFYLSSRLVSDVREMIFRRRIPERKYKKVTDKKVEIGDPSIEKGI